MAKKKKHNPKAAAKATVARRPLAKPARKAVPVKPAAHKKNTVKAKIKAQAKPKTKTAKAQSAPPPQPDWQAAAKNWQATLKEQIDATRRAAGAASFTGGQTGLPPISQRYAAFFAQMSAPWLSMLSGSGTDKTDKTNMQDILTGWLESQRGFLELSLQQMTQQPDPAAFWRQTGLGMAEAAPSFWTEAARQSGAFGTANGPGAIYADMLRQGRAFDPFDMLASLPGLGYSRERHEDFAKLYKAWHAHEAAQRHYMAEMVKIALVAMVRFEDSLKNPPADKKPLSSLKDVYAHWVDISEDAYAQFALSDDHARIYAAMVDTSSALKKETNHQADQWAAQWNLPTRAEVDSLHKSMHELRRENRDLRRRMQEDGRRPGRRS